RRSQARRPRRGPRRGRAGGRQRQGGEASRGRADRAHPRAASDRLRAARDGTSYRGPHAAPDLRERAAQDARGHPLHGSLRPTVVVALAGGTGGAKLAAGLYDLLGPDQLVVIADTGDDVEIHGVHVSPDPDLVTYWLADVIDERGWGIAGDTWKVMAALEAAGRPAWFRLGDRDLAMCAVRTGLLREGKRLTEAHAAVVEGMGVDACVLPMSDDVVATWVRCRGDWRPFQELM